MGSEAYPELRGFDSYELKLGDQLRGERASMGKSLLDVQRELRICADYIDAIENADISAFPFTGITAGYVRSYARYLDLDGDDVFRRFCAESGFKGVEMPESYAPSVKREKVAKDQPRPAARSAADQAIITNRFMKSNTAAMRMDIGASLRGVASIAVLITLVGGLGYGGWTLLQDLQRLGFAPLPTAPEVLVTAPDILAPTEVAEAEPKSSGVDDEARVTLASIYAAQEAAVPVFTPRDGPISAIDPKSAGVYAVPSPSATPVIVADTPDAPAVSPEDFGFGAADRTAPQTVSAEAGAEQGPPAPVAVAARGVYVYATEDAWVRIRDGERKVLFTGILGPGERFTLPEGATEPQLRAGNAGAVFIIIDGAAYGPLGNGPQVAKKVDLKPEAVRASWPAAPNFSETPVNREAALQTGDDAVALSNE